MNRKMVIAILLYTWFSLSGGANLVFYKAQSFVEYLPPNVDTKELTETDSLNTFATPGEFEPLTCGIYAEKGVSGLKVVASDLICGEYTISAEELDLRILKYWYQRGYRWRGRYLIPDILLHDDNLITVDLEKRENILNFQGLPVDPPELAPFSIEKGNLKQLWITIYVPENTQSGLYRGKLQFIENGSTVGNLTIELEVLDFVLDEPRKDYGVYFPSQITEQTWSTNPKGGVNHEATYLDENLFRIQCSDLRDRGIMHPQFNLPLSIRDDGTLDFTNVKKMMDIRKEYGLDKSPYFVTGIPGILEAKESEGKLKVFLGHVEQVLNFFEAYGWPRPYVYGYDEAKGEELEQALPVYRAIKRTGAQIAVACYSYKQMILPLGKNQPSYGWLEIAGPLIDLPIVPQNVLKVPEIEIDKAHEQGSKMWFYALPQTHWDEFSPYVYRSNYGFWLFNSNADGICPWGYQFAVGNPFDDFDEVDEGKLTDCFAVYPTQNGIVPTLLWEAFREGIDDCRYASTLINLLEKERSLHGQTELVRQMEELVRKTEVDYIFILNNLYDPQNFKPILIYGEDLKQQLHSRPDLQQLRRQCVEGIAKLKESSSDL